MNIPRKVTVVEVGPRDGFQNEPMFIPTNEKIKLINKLSETGLSKIEATVFGHPKVMPQVADAAEVLAGITRWEGVTYILLVPNLRGMERVLQAKVDKLDELRVVVSASEAYNKALLNKSVSESLDEIKEITRMALDKGWMVGGHISSAFGCSVEGWVPAEQVEGIAETYIAMGVHELILGDTTGMAHPQQVSELVRRLQAKFKGVKLGLHFHDTRGAGLANVYAGLIEGVTMFDSSIGGLGGCPFAPGATGNIATEDLVHLLESMGIDTGINLTKLLQCGKLVQDVIGKELPSHVLKAGPVPWALKIGRSRSKGRDIK